MNDPLESDSSPEDNSPEEKSDTPYEAPQAEAPSSKPSSMIFPAMGQGQLDEKGEKFWAMLGHALSLTGIPSGGIGYLVGPLIPYLMKKGESPYVDEHAKETLNFSILTAIVVFGSGALGFAACFMWIITTGMAILNLIYCVQGAIAAKNGEAYRYPFNWRIIK